MATITKSLTIESQGTYNLTFDLWSYSEWAASAGITTSYASLAALIADEKAVRQLMTVHASVDYFANCPDSTIISTVINNDLCAKWINLRDYALDTLSAKSNIKSVMDTANKYGYGEWGKIDSTTWGPLGNVPIMTANNAPYGVASAVSEYDSSLQAWKAFNGQPNTTWQSDTVTSGNPWIRYQSIVPICVKKVHWEFNTNIQSTWVTMFTQDYAFKVQGSNDGSTWEDIGSEINVSRGSDNIYKVDANIDNTEYFTYYQLLFTKCNGATSGGRYGFASTLQFYGRELKPLVPIMTANDKPKGQVSASSYNTDYSMFPWQAFDKNTSTKWGGALGSAVGSWLQYTFANSDKIIKYMSITPGHDGRYGSSYTWLSQFGLVASNDNFATTPTQLLATQTINPSDTSITTLNYPISNNTIFSAFRLNNVKGVDNDGYGQVAELQLFGMDYSEKEFATGSTMKYIYDHGVTPSGAITGGTKNPDCLTLSAVGTATITIDKGTRKYMGGKAGLHASGTNRLKCGSGYSNFTASNMPDSNGLDISSISGSVAVGIEQTANGTFDCTEIWLE